MCCKGFSTGLFSDADWLRGLIISFQYENYRFLACSICKIRLMGNVLQYPMVRKKGQIDHYIYNGIGWGGCKLAMSLHTVALQICQGTCTYACI